MQRVSGEPRSTPPSRNRYRFRSVFVLFGIVTAASACASEAAPEITVDDYRAQMSAVCATSITDRATLAEPADASAVAAFATQVGNLVDREADAARSIRPPDELDDDHRAFVQNTSDQATQWTALGATAPDDPAFSDLRTEILQLTLGRDDLATEMGLPACVRAES